MNEGKNWQQKLRSWLKDDITEARADRYGLAAGFASLILAIWTFAGVMNDVAVALVSFFVAAAGLLPAAVAYEKRMGKDGLFVAAALWFVVPTLALLILLLLFGFEFEPVINPLAWFQS